MTQTLWGETKRSGRRRKRDTATRTSTTPYSVTGSDDCMILSHTLNHFDLAGCTTCMDCAARIFCPQCIAQHPTDPKAVAILCPRHEESGGSA